MMAYGFRARRLALGMSIQQLCEESGLSPYIIHCCEEGDFNHISLHRMIRLADTLGITLGEGCSRRWVSCRRRPRPHRPCNALEQYMAFWDLTLEGMAMILNVSVQTVSNQCEKAIPDQRYIRRLAEEENLSVQDFLEMYGAMRCA